MSGARKQNTNEKKTDLSATGIVRLAEKAQVKLFHTAGREAFASFWVRDHWENCLVKSTAFQVWLSGMCYHQEGGVPSQKALTEATNTFAADALYASPEKRVFVRIAEHNDEIYLDLGNDSWESIKITGEGWQVVPHTPVKFVRAPGMQALPHPIDGGRIDALRPFLNLCDDDQWKLAVSWLMGALRPAGHCPIL